MASLRKRGGKKNYWYALFRDASGKLVERSTKTDQRKRAQELADEWERLSRPSAGSRTAENMRKVIADLHRKYLHEEAPKMSVTGYRDYWLMSKRAEISAATSGFYAAALKLFIGFLGEVKAAGDLFAVRKEDVVRFRDSEKMRVTGKTVNHELKVLRMFFKAAHEDGWITENPCEGVKAVREDRAERSPKRPFTFEELQQLLEHCDAEWKAMVLRGYYTGQRLCDIATMSAKMEDLAQGQVVFRTGKTGRMVIVEMHPAYHEWAMNQPSHDSPEAPLHPRAAATVAKNAKGSTTTLSGQFADILWRAGLRSARKHRKREGGKGRSGRHVMEALTFHSLRHSLVSHLQDAGVSRTIVQDIVGHESEQINAIYTRLDRETKKAAMAKLPNITTSRASSAGS